NVEMIPIRVFKNKEAQTSDIAEAIEYSIDQNVDIINMSFGGSNTYNTLSNTIGDSLKNASEEGIILIAAAGNTGGQILYPASAPETIAVGATDINNNIASYSNTGPELDLVAPGGNGNGILSTSGYYQNGTEYTNEYVLMEGTSMATPYVSGVASLLLSQGVSPDNIKDRLTSTAVDLLPSGKDSTYGYGLVDAYGALLDKRLKKPYIFAATKENGSIDIKSEFETVDRDNTYKLDEIVEDKVYIIGWRDVNDDKIINKGDYYGEYEKEINLLENSLYNNIDIEMYYIPQNDNTNIEVMNMTEVKSE
ncbi:MAG TPA: S8 family serine peptidase, partial [Halanaerobiales bacterium]|nr:S8 family serine peptidase [Halanaerobiales bacterium]